PPPAIYTLSLHDALPIFRPLAALCLRNSYCFNDWKGISCTKRQVLNARPCQAKALALPGLAQTERGAARSALPGCKSVSRRRGPDRKSTRLNSSHVAISY